jgi:hypothetical protein
MMRQAILPLEEIAMTDQHLPTIIINTPPAPAIPAVAICRIVVVISMHDDRLATGGP